MATQKIDEFKKWICNKKAAILGLGISHTPLIQYMYNMGADITVMDSFGKQQLEGTISKFKGLDIEYILGKSYLDGLKNGDFDIIFRTPGIRADIPEILEATSRGAILTSEMEMFFKLCPAPIIAVTGSDGKTTTTTLISKMLEAQGHKVWLGGNIGVPLMDKVEEIDPEDHVVIELSSFQLQTFKQSPPIAVITNISPNHLDWHSDYIEYIECKKNIYRYQMKDNQGKKARLILNYDNAETRKIGKELDSERSVPIWFSRQQALESGVYVKDGDIYLDDKRIMDESSILIPGTHNIENYLAAIAATKELVSPKSIQKVAENFTGVEHRIEFVREVDGVKYYNDSIASSPKRTIAGLASFARKIILIAGGKDKGIPYDEIGAPIIQGVKTLILIGATAHKIDEAVKEADGEVETVFCSTYPEAVAKARDVAIPGDIVMLSPASTSFDMFKNFEERGRTFKQLVSQL